MTYELVCSVDDLPEVGAAKALVGGTYVALVRDDSGHLHAVEDECSHGAVSLSEGEVSGCLIECWLHGSRFDLNTGDPKGPPATAAIKVYAVKVEGQDVYVDVDSTVPAGPVTLTR